MYDVNSKRVYIGFTSNLLRRLKEHKKARLSHRNRNFKLIYYEAFINKTDALKRERYLKSSKGRISMKNILKNTLSYIGGSSRTT